MCRISDAVTHPVVPKWITQSRDEVADAELEAASIHYTYMTLVVEKPDEYPANIYGDYQWHERWWQKHQEAAWFTSPEYTEKRVGR